MNRFAALVLGSVMLLTPALAQAEPAIVTARLNLQSGPGGEYPAVAFLEPGVAVDVIGCLQGYGWCDVTVGRDRGWVPGAGLQAAEQGVRQPLPQLAPEFGVPVVGFNVGGYWERHYRDRPWYAERDRWDRRPHRAGEPPGDWHRDWERGRDRDPGRPGPDWNQDRPGRDWHRPPPERDGRWRDEPRPAGGPPPPRPWDDRGPPR